MIAWAELVEPAYGARSLASFRRADWPPVQPRHAG